MNDKRSMLGLCALSICTVLSVAHANVPQSKPVNNAITAQPINKIDINKASAKDIARVFNGFGKKRAAAIVTFREEHGDFKSLNDLAHVKGISKQMVKRKLPELTKVFIILK